MGMYFPISKDNKDMISYIKTTLCIPNDTAKTCLEEVHWRVKCLSDILYVASLES